MSSQLSNSTLHAAPVAIDPSSSRPSAHAQRYDRQLRLWASSGQRSLESAHLLCVGSTALAGQILKNLVLPGVGRVTVIDDAPVTEADLGNNFFLEEESLGRSRAREMTRFVCELNPDVKGEAREESPASLLSENAPLLQSATLVLLVSQAPDIADAICDALWEADASVPALVVRSSGLVGEVRVQARECGIIETHPESTDDLRLVDPFPELRSFVDTYKVDRADSHAYSHIPFVVILRRALDKWETQHGKLPTSDDRKAFTALVNEERDSKAEGENFDEAVAAMGKHIWRALSAPKVPTAVEELFAAPECEQIGPKSSNFWLLLHALRSFVRSSPSSTPRGSGGRLPLPGSVPDMKALSPTYVALVGAYRTRAAADLADFQQHLDATLQRAGVREGIDAEEVARFVKLAGYVRLIKGRKMRDVKVSPRKDAIAAALSDPINPVVVPHALAFMAADEFFLAHRRYPGSSRAFAYSLHGGRSQEWAQQGQPSYDGGVRESKRQRSGEPEDGDDEHEPDAADDERELQRLAEAMCARLDIVDESDTERVEDACLELVRSGHADVPSTAALLGGVAAQEAIKLITRQYIPLDNTAVYDGVQQAVGTFCL